MTFYRQMVIRKLLGHNYLLLQVILYTGLITWASLAKFVNPIQVDVKDSDKIAHFGAYFVFAFIWFLFLFFSRKRSEGFNQSLIKSFLICFLYGLAMEIAQATLTDYRSFDWKDVLANTSGIIFVVILLKMFENKLIRFESSRA